jgi:hypothetical protein
MDFITLSIAVLGAALGIIAQNRTKFGRHSQKRHPIWCN